MIVRSMAALAALSVCAPLAAQSVQATAAAPIVVQQPTAAGSGSMLPASTDVWVSLDRELSSKTTKKVGSPIDFKVSRDVMLGNYVVIPKGTPATGRLTYRTGKGAFGKSAKIEFDIDSINLNGRSIPVAGHYRIEGEGNTGAAIGAVVAVGVFGAFVTGRSAVAAQGSEWKVSTKEALTIQVAGASAGSLAPVSTTVLGSAN